MVCKNFRECNDDLFTPPKPSGVRRSMFPYCIDQQPDGGWVFLNRDYKPIGFNTQAFIRYEDFPVSMRLVGLGPKRRAWLDVHGVGTSSRIYLYNDGCYPTMSKSAMSRYLEKLAFLMSLSERDHR